MHPPDRTLLEFVLLASTSLFVIMDPIALIPAFLAMTPTDSPQERTRMASLACWVSLLVCILVVCFVCYVILRLAAHGVGWINPIAMKIATRIMGLLLAAVAVQFTLDALAEQRGKLF